MSALLLFMFVLCITLEVHLSIKALSSQSATMYYQSKESIYGLSRCHRPQMCITQGDHAKHGVMVLVDMVGKLEVGGGWLDIGPEGGGLDVGLVLWLGM